MIFTKKNHSRKAITVVNKNLTSTFILKLISKKKNKIKNKNKMVKKTKKSKIKN